MKKIAYNLLAILSLAVFVVVMALGNVFVVKTSVVAPEGSYAQKYAKSHHIPEGTLPDSMGDMTDIRYETFQYNEDGTGLSLTKYDGISENVVVPESINGKNVISLDKKFFDDLSVKELYLPVSIQSLPEEGDSSVIIMIPDNDTRKTEFEKNNWRVDTYSDSETPFFNLGDIPFEYDRKNDSIVLRLYTGNDDIIIVPSHIDGYPVSDVAFNMTLYSLVALPETVTSISGRLSAALYTPLFAIELIFTVLAFAIAMIVLNIALPKLQDAREGVLTGPQAYLTILFFIIQVIFAIYSITTYRVSTYIALIISIVLVGLEILTVVLVGSGRTHVKKVEEKIAVNTQVMDEVKGMTGEMLLKVQDGEAKAVIERLAEEVRYSPSSSYNALRPYDDALLSAMKEVQEAIKHDSPEMIIEKCSKALDALKLRNERAKTHR